MLDATHDLHLCTAMSEIGVFANIDVGDGTFEDIRALEKQAMLATVGPAAVR